MHDRVHVCSLDLDAWINEPPSESESEDEQPRAIFAKEEPKHSRPRHTEVDEKELARVRQHLKPQDLFQVFNLLVCLYLLFSLVLTLRGEKPESRNKPTILSTSNPPRPRKRWVQGLTRRGEKCIILCNGCSS